MFKISYDKKITMVQGDTGVIRMRIHNYELSQGDEVRFAIVNKANPSILLCQHSDKKIVLEKQVTVFEKDGSARIVIYPYDTEYLQPGKYLYEIQVKTKDGRIDTVVPLASFTLIDGSIQGEYGQTTPSKPEPTPSEIELRFKRLENEIIPELGNRITNVEKEIDSVSSSLDNITNDGYVILDSIGITAFSTEEQARANVYNSDLIQPLLDKGQNLQFNKGFYAFDKQFNFGINSIKGRGKTLSNLIFPNSKGISFTKETWVGNIVIKDLSITSKLHCIDFRNDDTGIRPYNIYQSYIGDLFLNSEEGHCVYGGDGRGKGSDQLVFEQIFNNIRVTAPNGSGFYGIGGLGIRFEKINDAFSIKNVFQNCHGQFYNINTSFAGAEYFLYFDKDCPPNYGVNLDFYNVNMEDVKKAGIYIESNQIDITSLIMNRTTFSLPATTTNHDIPPFYIPNIKKLELHSNSGTGSYPSKYDTSKVKTPFYCWNGGASIQVLNNEEFSVWSNIYNDVLTYNKKQGMTASPYTFKYGKSRHVVYDEIHANTLVGGRTKKVLNVNDRTYTFPNSEVYDELNYTITSPLDIPYISINTNNGTRMISIKNNNTSTSDLTIKHGTIKLIGNKDVILNPNDVLNLIYNGTEWVQIIMATDFRYYCGATSRPTNIFNGYSTYDATIGKPIWWTGSQWVDSQGNGV